MDAILAFNGNGDISDIFSINGKVIEYGTKWTDRLNRGPNKSLAVQHTVRGERVRGRPKTTRGRETCWTANGINIAKSLVQMLMMIASFSEHTRFTIYVTELTHFKRVNRIINIVRFLVYTTSLGRQSNTLLITSVCSVTGSACKMLFYRLQNKTNLIIKNIFLLFSALLKLVKLF